MYIFQLADYLCAVSRGLIQYVCRQAGKYTYRTLTADRIYIHPGSVMFREAPQFIVAGEIVRTSRVFARSVSPLKKEWLGLENSASPRRYINIKELQESYLNAYPTIKVYLFGKKETILRIKPS